MLIPETDTTVTILRRIWQNNGTIAEFVNATASHLRRFESIGMTPCAPSFSGSCGPQNLFGEVYLRLH